MVEFTLANGRRVCVMATAPWNTQMEISMRVPGYMTSVKASARSHSSAVTSTTVNGTKICSTVVVVYHTTKAPSLRVYGNVESSLKVEYTPIRRQENRVKPMIID